MPADLVPRATHFGQLEKRAGGGSHAAICTRYNGTVIARRDSPARAVQNVRSSATKNRRAADNLEQEAGAHIFLHRAMGECILRTSVSKGLCR
jgi:hypothetical protein